MHCVLNKHMVYHARRVGGALRSVYTVQDRLRAYIKFQRLASTMLLVLPTKAPRQCPHKKQRSKCVQCGGKRQVALRCPHALQRSKCEKCGGKRQVAAVCQHGRQPYMCFECGGAGTCVHGRQRHGCAVCDPEGRVSKARRSADGRAFGRPGETTA